MQLDFWISPSFLNKLESFYKIILFSNTVKYNSLFQAKVLKGFDTAPQLFEKIDGLYAHQQQPWFDTLLVGT